jgi:hypothetical protein
MTMRLGKVSDFSVNGRNRISAGVGMWPPLAGALEMLRLHTAIKKVPEGASVTFGNPSASVMRAAL